jgi:UDP-N-acetylglucosamine 2-epimerase (non-hydrolysing)
VVGARPNFMKLFPLVRAFRRRPGVEHLIVHTGQHYDPLLSERLFKELRLPDPDHHLGIGSGSQAEQTAAAMTQLEPLFETLRPDLVLVYGDVNSTLAAALVAAKGGWRLGHVEAGLRSGDRTMPEEVNRLVTDRLADLHFAPSADAVEHLRGEGAPAERIHAVGNVMIDTLVALLPKVARARVPARFGVEGMPYIVSTLHRPANVDHTAGLLTLLDTLGTLAADLPVIFPMHPRTRARVEALGWRGGEGLRLLPPLGYIEMLGLVRDAAVVITDSGGVQEETSFLGVPCLTVRDSTERPITCRLGTNRLVARDRNAILGAVRQAALRRPATPPVIPLWDGRAGERIADLICGGATVADPPGPARGRDDRRAAGALSPRQPRLPAGIPLATSSPADAHVRTFSTEQER